MKHYEYKIAQPGYGNKNSINVANWLTEMDIEGWEFVSIDYPRTNNHGETIRYEYQYYIFRREINPQEKNIE